MEGGGGGGKTPPAGGQLVVRQQKEKTVLAVVVVECSRTSDISLIHPAEIRRKVFFPEWFQ